MCDLLLFSVLFMCVCVSVCLCVCACVCAVCVCLCVCVCCLFVWNYKVYNEIQVLIKIHTFKPSLLCLTAGERERKRGSVFSVVWMSLLSITFLNFLFRQKACIQSACLFLIWRVVNTGWNQAFSNMCENCFTGQQNKSLHRCETKLFFYFYFYLFRRTVQ